MEHEITRSSAAANRSDGPTLTGQPASPGRPGPEGATEREWPRPEPLTETGREDPLAHLEQAAVASVRPVKRPGGVLVEGVRLVLMLMFAAAGWQVATSLFPGRSSKLVLGTLLGSGVGFVLGGVFGRRTASALSDVERAFRKIPAATILAGGIGLGLGLVLATLVSLPLFHLPDVAAYPTVALVYVVLGYLGNRVGRVKSEELFGLFGVKPVAAGTSPGEVTVLDSSAILDGRVGKMIRLGFLGGTLLVTRSVLQELQAVADSSDFSRRSRGRKALDLLVALKRDPSVDVQLVEERADDVLEEVDAQLVRLARKRGGVLLTNDSALARVAAALDVPVRSIDGLADALRPVVLAGEHLDVRLTRSGRASGQAVGYLDDGTMVVVENAGHLLGDSVAVSVTNTLQTATGRMVFGRLVADAEV